MGWLEQTRMSYDAVAEDYRPIVAAAFDSLPVERSMLTAFAAAVTSAGGGRVLDIGCGPGDVTSHCVSLGLDMFGVDLSPGMLTVARGHHPAIDFRIGDMTALDLPENDLAGIVSWWSTVHLPPVRLPRVFAEFHRVLMPGGHLLLGFHAGDERRHKTEAYGDHAVDLDVYLRPPEVMREAGAQVGFRLLAQLLVGRTRATAADQCCLLFRKPGNPPPCAPHADGRGRQAC